MKKLFYCVLLFITANTASAQLKKWVVAQDGTGDFTTMQAAIDAVTTTEAKRIEIFIKKGIYKERLTIPVSVNNVSFVGENVAETILTYDNYASKKDSAGNNYGTTGSSSLFVDGSNISFENITFENSSGPVGQAVAVNITGTKVAFKNCRFLGFQDTLYTKGAGSLQYYKDCYIEGTVDFIFGAATALFDNCVIRSKLTGGYITAASTPEGTPFGYVFINCSLVSDSAHNNVYLGRPWRPFAKTVFINCKIDKHIKPEGWNNWGKRENEQTVFYAEYQNTGLGADSTNRVSWSRQLQKEEVKQYTKKNILNGWNPF
jgi:pectinesterase